MTQETPKLSPSIAHKLTTESPRSAWAAHRLLGDFRKEPTSSQIEGRLWHAAILEGGAGVEFLDFESFRSNEAKAAKDAVLEAGNIPATMAQKEAMAPAVARIKEELAAIGVSIDGGNIEKRFEWTEFTEGGEPVECSGVIDQFDGMVIRDVKSGKAAVTPRMAGNLIAKSHALLQDAAYKSALSKEGWAEYERIEMQFIFVQTQEPFTPTPVTLSGEFRELSFLRWRRAIETWHRCLSQGTDKKYWPGPTDGVVTVHPPGWMISEEIEMEAIR